LYAHVNGIVGSWIICNIKRCVGNFQQH
jgi:hypothetical protein